MTKRDTGLDMLLDLHGQILVVDEQGGHWVKFLARRVPVTKTKSHGLDYSLTLHDASGERLVGFDNAHGHDHTHRHKVVKQYVYKDAESLLEDFWLEVDKVLKKRGVIE